MFLTLIDHDRGNLNPHSLEMLTLVRATAEASGDPFEAVLIGPDAAPLADGLGLYGVSRVHVVEHPELQDYAPEAWASSVVQLVGALSPKAVAAPGTDRGGEVMAHVAAILDQPLSANCTAVQPGDPYTVTRVRWGGSLLEEATLDGDPILFTVAPHTVEAGEAPIAGAVEVVPFSPELGDSEFRVRLIDREEEAGDKVSLAEARVVVGGGRGVGSAEGFAPLETLAGLLGGAVGGSRVVTNLGWRPHAEQIGQTGTRIAPDLYIACGISGAIQHMVGCMGAKRILAINIDREAPIMNKADYAVIGDVQEILPALVDALGAESG